MINPYMTLYNGPNKSYTTEITFSNPYLFKGLKCIDVFVETATDNDLINVCICMPFGTIKEAYGMDNATITFWVNFIKKNYSLIANMALRKEVTEHAKSI